MTTVSKGVSSKYICVSNLDLGTCFADANLLFFRSLVEKRPLACSKVSRTRRPAHRSSIVRRPNGQSVEIPPPNTPTALRDYRKTLICSLTAPSPAVQRSRERVDIHLV